MPKAQTNITEENDLLCETCGYVLNGLPTGSNCPECGTPASDSAPSRRGPPAWERSGKALFRYLSTTAELLVHPSRFYRHLNTRHGRAASARFAWINQAIAAALFGTTAYIHIDGLRSLSFWWNPRDFLEDPLTAIPLYSVATLLVLALLTRLAARLSHWEATYRGMRLPLRVVLRGLDFHSVHYLPVALASLATVAGYRTLIRLQLMNYYKFELDYIYVLCGEVIMAAGYLFWTYWAGMKNMLYANA